jgi:hypothetical protein
MHYCGNTLDGLAQFKFFSDCKARMSFRKTPAANYSDICVQ